MSLTSILTALTSFFSSLPKQKIIDALLQLREDYKKLAKENEKLRKLIDKETLKKVNLNTNKPSSKQAEWDARSHQW